MIRGRQTLAVLTVLLVFASAARAADYVWIEAEKASSANVKLNATGYHVVQLK